MTGGPRLVAPLCARGRALDAAVARPLWLPEEREAQLSAVWVLFGTLLFAAFITLTMMRSAADAGKSAMAGWWSAC
jgi:hypothetical protein